MYDLRIDGDTIVYRAGFAADSRGGELSHSLYNAKLIMDMLISHFSPCNASCYLTDTDNTKNFRFNIAEDYKANRRSKICGKCESSDWQDTGIITKTNGGRFKGKECLKCKNIIESGKPIYYKELRQYLIDRYNAIVCQWGEADDWLGSSVTCNTIIASNDKDLLMIPCWHYRISSAKLLKGEDPGTLWVSANYKKILGVGFKWFAAQMLLGDTVDHIKKPKRGDGIKWVYNLLKDNNDIHSLWNTVKYYYRAVNKEDLLLINATLLWMSRSPCQVFSEELIDDLS